jgi:antitoxin component YwqK of YwqJK toxin-antitoxin module
MKGSEYHNNKSYVPDNNISQRNVSDVSMRNITPVYLTPQQEMYVKNEAIMKSIDMVNKAISETHANAREKAILRSRQMIEKLAEENIKNAVSLAINKEVNKINEEIRRDEMSDKLAFNKMRELYNKKENVATHDNSTRNGEFRFWHDDGHAKEFSNWEDGKKNGQYHTWYSNGQLKERSNWNGGQKYGLYETWDENGYQLTNNFWIDGVDHYA